MKKNKTLSTSALALISISAILSIRSLPLTAHLGLEAVGFYILAAIGFLLPSSLVCAQLGSTIQSQGGIYCWVKTAFGPKWGFVAIWMEWVNNVIGFPATLSTVSATMLYIVMPSLSHHRWILFGLMMLVLWSLTAFNALGIKASSHLSTAGALFGTILPGVLVIALGFVWAFSGHMVGFLKESIHPSFAHFSFSDIALFVAVLGAYSGMQVTSFHARDVGNPHKQFPQAIAIACSVILVLSIGATLALCAVVPPSKMNIISGVIQMFSVFFAANHMSFILPIFIGLISFGMVASLSNWMLGPARGLQVAVSEGHLPQQLAKLNRAKMPINILWLQGFVATALASVFIWMPTLSEAFWVLIALTSQFTVLMYCLVFASSIYHRWHYSASQNKAFLIPFGFYGTVFVCMLGLLSCLAGFIVGFCPPTSIGIHSQWHYVLMMLAVDAFIIVTPILISSRNPN